MVDRLVGEEVKTEERDTCEDEQMTRLVGWNAPGSLRFKPSWAGVASVWSVPIDNEPGEGKHAPRRVG